MRFDHAWSALRGDIPTGNRLGTLSRPGDGERARRGTTAFIIRQNDRYWLLTENGDLIMASLTPEGYNELGRAHRFPTDWPCLRPPGRVVLTRFRQPAECTLLQRHKECVGPNCSGVTTNIRRETTLIARPRSGNRCAGFLPR